MRDVAMPTNQEIDRLCAELDAAEEAIVKISNMACLDEGKKIARKLPQMLGERVPSRQEFGADGQTGTSGLKMLLTACKIINLS